MCANEVTSLSLSGKTHLLNVLLDTVRLEGKKALAVAISGVASLALHHGRTAHSTFAIPIKGLNEQSTCAMRKQMDIAKKATAAHLIVWDEISMADKNQLDAVDRSLRVRHFVINLNTYPTLILCNTSTAMSRAIFMFWKETTIFAQQLTPNRSSGAVEV